MTWPQIIRLRPNLHCAKFALVKILSARHMLACARRQGLIAPGSLILETTSGTFALALAIVCRLEGYRLIIVSDPAIDQFLQVRLELLGAEVVLVPDPAPVGGYQRSRLEKLAELKKKHPDAYWPCQYDHPWNAESFWALGDYLAKAVGRIDCLVGAIGSGGTMSGCTRSLRKRFPNLYAIAIDSYGSVLFGQPDRKRLLRGAGSSIVFGNVDHASFDEVHWVAASEAFAAARRLYEEKALFMGGTSGAAYMVAEWWARAHPQQTAVAIFPDEGFRYQHTIYSNNWLEQNNVWRESLPDEPKLVDRPAEAKEEWSRFMWNRRTYENVVGAAPPRCDIASFS